MEEKYSESSMEITDEKEKHFLYQKNVQNPKKEIEVFRKKYKNIFKKLPTKFREDFCGTGQLCCEWVKCNVSNTAVGIDYDLDTIDFGIENNVKNLSSGQERVKLIHQNVLSPYDKNEKFHIICSMNYSHFILHKRLDLVQYFKNVKANLNSKGLFIFDFFGGAHVYDYHKHTNSNDCYRYSSEPINILNNVTLISLNFKNEKNKFVPLFDYSFRMYSLIELKEALEDAGFNQFKIFIKEVSDEESNSFIDYEEISFNEEYYPKSERYNGYFLSYYS